MVLPKKKTSAKPEPTSQVRLGNKRLRRAWEIGRSGFPVLFSICFVARIPPFFIRLLYILLWPDAADNPNGLNVVAALLLALYEVGSFFFGGLALFYAVGEISENRRVSVYEAFVGAFARTKDGLITAVWWGGFIGLGTICFLIPGLVFLVQYAFAGFIVVKEGLAGRDALARSKRIVMRVPSMIVLNFIGLIILCLGVVVVVQGPLGLLMGFAFGLFDLPEDSAAVAIVFDLIRLTAAQAVPVVGAVFLWALYEDVTAEEEPFSSSNDPELIAL